VVRWRRIDLSRVIEQRYGVKLAERSVGELLRRLGFELKICASAKAAIVDPAACSALLKSSSSAIALHTAFAGYFSPLGHRLRRSCLSKGDAISWPPASSLRNPLAGRD
jgi:hypothetical protein